MKTYCLEGFGPLVGWKAEFIGDLNTVNGEVDKVWSCEELDFQSPRGTWDCSYGPVSCGKAKQELKFFKVVA